jgi:non-specific serine/threonine protein kinase
MRDTGQDAVMTLLADRYVLHGTIGEGGMGVVFRATDSRTEETVAIKKLRPEMLNEQDTARERFVRESQALRALNHPNIVKALDFIEDSSGLYIVMELVAGTDLGDVIARQGALPLQRVLQIAIELSDALTRAHYLRIVHRDLKPANVLMTESGTPKLTDFGVAYLETSQRVTHAGLTVGTPSYMAPEALNSQDIDHRADIWALGILIYEMLTGKHPFHGVTMSATIMNILTFPTPDLEHSRPDLPPALVDLVYRMLEKNPAARISSVRLVGAELELMLRGAENQAARGDERTVVETQSAPDLRFADLTQVNIRHNLPAQTTPLVGREDELDEIAQMLNLPDTRLITILGPGGMGKTRLALAAAQQLIGNTDTPVGTTFPNGIFLVELAALPSAEPLIAAVANALGMAFSGEASPKDQLLDFLREKELLLVLDNFEHVMDGAATVTDILQAAPGIRVIVTSREKLNLSGETLFNLHTLSVPEGDTAEAVESSYAGRLFLQGARRARPDFEPDAQTSAQIARLCRRVDGMPLGIVLAAGWVEQLSVAEILEELERDLDFLETTLRDVPERHRSIRAVFDYSWKLMTEDERRLVMALSVFRGGLSRRAGQEVTGATLRQLAALVGKSLLRRDPDAGSYHMHELLRQYVEDKLATSGNAENVHQAHSVYYLKVLQELRSGLEGADQLGTLAKIADDFENLRAAWQWAANHMDYAPMESALPTLTRYFILRGQHSAAETLLSQTASQLRGQSVTRERDRLLAYVLAEQAAQSIPLFHDHEAEDAIAEAGELLEPLNAPMAQATLDVSVGQYHLNLKKAGDSQPYFERAARAWRSAGEAWALAMTLQQWATSHWYRSEGAPDDLTIAQGRLLEALSIQQKLGDVFGQATTTLALGTVASYIQDDEEDARRTAEALALFQKVNHLVGMSHALNNLGVRELLLGNYEQARPYLLRALETRREMGNVAAITFSLFTLSRLGFSEGDFTTAIQRANEGLALVVGTVYQEWELTLLLNRAPAHLALGDAHAAIADFTRAGELAQERENHDDVRFALAGRGQAALAAGDFADAQQWISQALASAEADSDVPLAMLCHTLLARWAVARGELHRGEEWIAPAAAYFSDEEAWQASYTIDPWQLSGWAVETLVTHGDILRASGKHAQAALALISALDAAGKMVSPAHQALSLAAAADVLISMGKDILGAALARFITDLPQAYASDKARSTETLGALNYAVDDLRLSAAVARAREFTLTTAVGAARQALTK